MPWFDGRYMIGELPLEVVEACTHSGKCDNDVEFWLKELDFTVPAASAEYARDYIISTGGWDREEVAEMTHHEVNRIILWLAAGAAKESMPFYLGE